MSEDKQSCFEQALNSDEREATDRRLVAVAVWVLYQSSLLQRVTGPFCFWSHGSPTHVQNDQWNDSIQLSQQLFVTSFCSPGCFCHEQMLWKKPSGTHLQSLARSLCRADRPVHRSNVLLMLHQHALAHVSVCLGERRWTHCSLCWRRMTERQKACTFTLLFFLFSLIRDAMSSWNEARLLCKHSKKLLRNI